jgi:hypothetical protein
MQVNDLANTLEISPPLGDPDSNSAGVRAAPARPVKDRPVFILKSCKSRRQKRKDDCTRKPRAAVTAQIGGLLP